MYLRATPDGLVPGGQLWGVTGTPAESADVAATRITTPTSLSSTSPRHYGAGAEARGRPKVTSWVLGF